MTDLGERFEALGRTRSPDLWREVEGREPRSLPSPPTPRRAIAIVVAFSMAAAGLGLAALTFGDSEQPATRRSGALPGPMANGEIWFRVGGGDGGSRIESVAPDGSGRRVVFEEEPTRVAQVAWSPDGTRIAYQNPIVDERGIFVANADGSGAVRLTEGWNDGAPSWSPDGLKIVFTRTSVQPGDERCIPGTPHDFRCPTDIYVMDADGSHVVRLTDDPSGEFMPVWSPAGDRIAFTREGDAATGANESIYTMRPDGSDVRQVSSPDGGRHVWPSWSPEGEQLVFASSDDDWEIWVVDANGSNPRMILGGSEVGYVDNPVWSPDGSMIAFIGNRTVDDYSTDDALYVMRPDGSGVTPLAEAPGIGVAGDIAWRPIPVLAEPVEPTPSPSPLVPTTAEVIETFEVGQDVRSVAYGEGSVWVATSNNDGSFGGQIIRIDPETRQVQAEIPVDVIPTWEVGGGAMVFADGDLWVAGDLEAAGAFDDPGGGADAAVIRIDTSTNEVVETNTVGGAGGADLTFLNGELWMLLFGDESVDHDVEVVRVDPSTGDDTARIPLDTGWAHTIVAARGRLVVLESGPGAANAAGNAAVIDPRTNTVARAKVPSEYMTPMPVVSSGQVWIALDPGFARLDPQAVAFPDPVVAVPRRFSDCCGFVEADDRGIWFLGLAENGTDRVLSLFDPGTHAARELVALEEEATPVAMAIAPDSVWILNYEGSLTHVELG
jgi:Tol biopolymer transport system component